MTKPDKKEALVFEAWKKAYDAYRDALQQSDNMKGSPEQQLGAAKYAQNTWNSVDPAKRASDDSITDVNTGLVLAKLHRGAEARTPFLGNLEAIVGELPVNALAERFVAYKPIEKKGDEVHNARIKAHKNYLAVRELVDKANEGDVDSAMKLRTEAQKNYATQLTKKVTESIDGKKDWDAKTKEITKQLVGALYARRGFDPEVLAKEQVNYVKGLEGAFTGLFKDEDEKAEYARSNLLNYLRSEIGDGKDLSKVDAAMAFVYDSMKIAKKK